jgi:hypothetical protein
MSDNLNIAPEFIWANKTIDQHHIARVLRSIFEEDFSSTMMH